MYTKDLCKRVTIRLDDQLSEFITYRAERLKVTPSQCVRMILHAYFDSLKLPRLTAATNLPPRPQVNSTEKAFYRENHSFNKHDIL